MTTLSSGWFTRHLLDTPGRLLTRLGTADLRGTKAPRPQRKERRQTSLPQFRDYSDPLCWYRRSESGGPLRPVILPLVVDAEYRADGVEEVGYVDRAVGHRGYAGSPCT